MAEQLRDIQLEAAGRPGEAEARLRSCALLVAARHGGCDAWHAHCWRRVAAAAGAPGGDSASTRLCVGLGEELGRYVPCAADGSAVGDERVRREVRGVHGLLVVEFLGRTAREPAQGLRVLDGLVGGDADGPLPGRLQPAALRMRAELLEGLGRLEEAAAALMQSLEGGERERGREVVEAGAGYEWEERYVAGFVATWRVAANRALGEASLAGGDLVQARQCLASHVQALFDLGGGPRLELERGRGLWAMARLCLAEVRLGEAAAYAGEALVKLEPEVPAGDPLLDAVRALRSAARLAQEPAAGDGPTAGGGGGGEEDEGDMDPLPAAEEVGDVLRRCERHYAQSELAAAHRLARAAVCVIADTASVPEALARLAARGDHPHAARALQSLCAAGRQRGLYQQAGDAARACLAMYERRGLARNHLDVVACAVELAVVLLERGWYREAAEQLELLGGLGLERRVDAGHPVLARLLVARAGLLQAQGRHGEALEALEQAHGALKARLAGRHERVVECGVLLVEALVLSSREDEARRQVPARGTRLGL